MIGLTHKQAELLAYIKAHMAAEGISPSFEEMKEALALKSKSGVHRLISALEERGFLHRLPNRTAATLTVPHADAGRRAGAAVQRPASGRVVAALPPIDSLTLADEPPVRSMPRAEKIARRDALRAAALEIPDPAEFAWQLGKPYCFWIVGAWRSQDPANSGCWKVSHAPELFSMGLCDRDGYLTAFGNQVRKAMLEQGA